jgi:hypothetical protein
MEAQSYLEKQQLLFTKTRIKRFLKKKTGKNVKRK